MGEQRNVVVFRYLLKMQSYKNFCLLSRLLAFLCLFMGKDNGGCCGIG